MLDTLGKHGLRWPLAEMAQQEIIMSAATSLPMLSVREALPQAILHTLPHLVRQNVTGRAEIQNNSVEK